MADKAFGVKDINLIGASGTPTIESPNNLNINAVNVAISTDITVAGKVSLGAGTSISSPGSNILTLGTNSVERIHITSDGRIGVGTNTFNDAAEVMRVQAAEGQNNTLFTIKANSTSGYCALNFGDDDFNEGRIIYDHSDNSMQFRTNDAEELRITGIGSVGVGVADPDSNFHVISSSNHVATFEYSSTADMAIQLKNSQGSMYFGLDGGERFAIATDADLNGTGNSKFTVDSSGRVRMPEQPAALVYKTGTNQAISSDAIVNYDSTAYSQGGMTINANRNRITVPVAGKYMITACSSGSCTTASAGDGWQLKILRDGATYNSSDGFPIETTGSETGQELAYTVSMVVDAADNDYFEIQIGNVGSARATMNRGYFGIYLLG